MKKIGIFSIFLLIFSFILIFPNSVSAEINGYKVSISCSISNLENLTPEPTSNFSASTNTLKMDYSYFANGGNIYFNATIEELEPQDEPMAPIYRWSRGDKVISQFKELCLSATLTTENYGDPLIDVGTTRYTLTVINSTDGSSIDVGVTIIITDNEKKLNIQQANSEIPTAINSSSEQINFYTKIPTTNQTTYTWLIKPPNISNYQEISHEQTLTFIPFDYISAFGYGEYKVMVIGEITSTKTKFYSSVYNIFAQPNAITAEPGKYIIKSNIVNNSLAKIEAFEYYLSDTSNMIAENICWYINGVKIATGKTFLYEPTTTDTYKVTVKYKAEQEGTVSYIDLCASFSETPKPTGMYILFIAIGAMVTLVGVILLISIKVSNKKRDVVW